MLQSYYARTGDGNALASLQRRMDEMEKGQRAAAAALSKVSGRDRFEDPSLPADDLASLRASLQQVPGLKGAWLARKSIPGTRRPLYALRVARAGLPSFSTDIALARQAAAAISLPGRVFVFTARTNGPGMAVKVKRAGVAVV